VRTVAARLRAALIGPSGQRQTAPQTFRTKTDADRWLAKVETDPSRGTRLDEDLGRETFGDYARVWFRDHPRTGPRYRETCRRNLRLHPAPLEDVTLRALTPAVVRQWHAAAMRGNGGRTSIAQWDRFLRAVMNTAMRDRAVVKNPCQIGSPLRPTVVRLRQPLGPRAGRRSRRGSRSPQPRRWPATPAIVPAEMLR
jgi:hypothetical protein